MIRFGKGEMKKKLEETMTFLQSVETETAENAHEEQTSTTRKNS